MTNEVWKNIFEKLKENRVVQVGPSQDFDCFPLQIYPEKNFKQDEESITIKPSVDCWASFVYLKKDYGKSWIVYKKWPC